MRGEKSMRVAINFVAVVLVPHASPSTDVVCGTVRVRSADAARGTGDETRLLSHSCLCSVRSYVSLSVPVFTRQSKMMTTNIFRARQPSCDRRIHRASLRTPHAPTRAMAAAPRGLRGAARSDARSLAWPSMGQSAQPRRHITHDHPRFSISSPHVTA